MQSFVSFAAQWFIAIPALLVAVTIVRRRCRRRDVLEAGIAAVLAIAFVKLSGMADVEARPFVVEHVQPLVNHVADNAFPSDHLAACGIAVAYLWPRSRALALVSASVAAVIAYARVAALLHWPDDVAAGFAFGVLAAVAARFATAFAQRNVPALNVRAT